MGQRDFVNKLLTARQTAKDDAALRVSEAKSALLYGNRVISPTDLRESIDISNTELGLDTLTLQGLGDSVIDPQDLRESVAAQGNPVPGYQTAAHPTSPIVGKTQYGANIHADGTYSVVTPTGKIHAGLSHVQADRFSVYSKQSHLEDARGVPEGTLEQKLRGIKDQFIEVDKSAIQGTLMGSDGITVEEQVQARNNRITNPKSTHSGVLGFDSRTDPLIGTDRNKASITPEQVEEYKRTKDTIDPATATPLFNELKELERDANWNKEIYERSERVAAKLKSIFPASYKDQMAAKAGYDATAKDKGTWEAIKYTFTNDLDILLSAGVDSTPWMIAYTIGGPVTQTAILTSLARAKGLQGIEEFKTKYGRNPDAQETQRIKLWKAFGAIAEKYGDLSALKLVKGKIPGIKKALTDNSSPEVLSLPSIAAIRIAGPLGGEAISGGLTSAADQMAEFNKIVNPADIAYDMLAEAAGTPGGLATMAAGQIAFDLSQFPRLNRENREQALSNALDNIIKGQQDLNKKETITRNDIVTDKGDNEASKLKQSVASYKTYLEDTLPDDQLIEDYLTLPHEDPEGNPILTDNALFNQLYLSHKNKGLDHKIAVERAREEIFTLRGAALAEVSSIIDKLNQPATPEEIKKTNDRLNRQIAAIENALLNKAFSNRDLEDLEEEINTGKKPERKGVVQQVKEGVQTLQTQFEESKKVFKKAAGINLEEEVVGDIKEESEEVGLPDTDDFSDVEGLSQEELKAERVRLRAERESVKEGDGDSRSKIVETNAINRRMQAVIDEVNRQQGTKKRSQAEKHKNEYNFKVLQDEINELQKRLVTEKGLLFASEISDIKERITAKENQLEWLEDLDESSPMNPADIERIQADIDNPPPNFETARFQKIIDKEKKELQERRQKKNKLPTPPVAPSPEGREGATAEEPTPAPLTEEQTKSVQDQIDSTITTIEKANISAEDKVNRLNKLMEIKDVPLTETQKTKVTDVIKQLTPEKVELPKKDDNEASLSSLSDLFDPKKKLPETTEPTLTPEDIEILEAAKRVREAFNILAKTATDEKTTEIVGAEITEGTSAKFQGFSTYRNKIVEFLDAQNKTKNTKEINRLDQRIARQKEGMQQHLDNLEAKQKAISDYEEQLKEVKEGNTLIVRFKRKSISTEPGSIARPMEYTVEELTSDELKELDSKLKGKRGYWTFSTISTSDNKMIASLAREVEQGRQTVADTFFILENHASSPAAKAAIQTEQQQALDSALTEKISSLLSTVESDVPVATEENINIQPPPRSTPTPQAGVTNEYSNFPLSAFPSMKANLNADIEKASNEGDAARVKALTIEFDKVELAQANHPDLQTSKKEEKSDDKNVVEETKEQTVPTEQAVGSQDSDTEGSDDISEETPPITKRTPGSTTSPDEEQSDKNKTIKLKSRSKQAFRVLFPEIITREGSLAPQSELNKNEEALTKLVEELDINPESETLIEEINSALKALPKSVDFIESSEREFLPAITDKEIEANSTKRRNEDIEEAISNGALPSNWKSRPDSSQKLLLEKAGILSLQEYINQSPEKIIGVDGKRFSDLVKTSGTGINTIPNFAFTDNTYLTRALRDLLPEDSETADATVKVLVEAFNEYKDRYDIVKGAKEQRYASTDPLSLLYQDTMTFEDDTPQETVDIPLQVVFGMFLFSKNFVNQRSGRNNRFTFRSEMAGYLYGDRQEELSGDEYQQLGFIGPDYKTSTTDGGLGIASTLHLSLQKDENGESVSEYLDSLKSALGMFALQIDHGIFDINTADKSGKDPVPLDKKDRDSTEFRADAPFQIETYTWNFSDPLRENRLHNNPGVDNLGKIKHIRINEGHKITEEGKSALNEINKELKLGLEDTLPINEPITEVDTFIQNSNTKIPEESEKGLKILQKTKWTPTESMFLVNLFDDIGLKDLLNNLIGINKAATNPFTHKKQQESITSSNRAKENNLKDILEALRKGRLKEVYFKYRMQINNRILQLGKVNPQQSKVHRPLLKSFDAPTYNEKNIHLFKLGVVYNLGIDVSKETRSNIETMFDGFLKDKTLLEAVHLLNKINKIKDKKPKATTKELNKDGAVDKLAELIPQLNKKWGRNKNDKEPGLTLLNSLNALSRYMRVDSLLRKTTHVSKGFVSDISLEIDGVSNGFAINALQFPIFTDEEGDTTLEETLKRVGIQYTSDGNVAHDTYAPDSYQVMAQVLQKFSPLETEINENGEEVYTGEYSPDIKIQAKLAQYFKKNPGTKATSIEIRALHHLFPDITDPQELRDIVKYPFLIFLYGGAPRSIAQGVGKKIVKAIYEDLDRHQKVLIDLLYKRTEEEEPTKPDFERLKQFKKYFQYTEEFSDVTEYFNDKEEQGYKYKDKLSNVQKVVFWALLKNENDIGIDEDTLIGILEDPSNGDVVIANLMDQLSEDRSDKGNVNRVRDWKPFYTPEDNLGMPQQFTYYTIDEQIAAIKVLQDTYVPPIYEASNQLRLDFGKTEFVGDTKTTDESRLADARQYWKDEIVPFVDSLEALGGMNKTRKAELLKALQENTSQDFFFAESRLIKNIGKVLQPRFSLALEEMLGGTTRSRDAVVLAGEILFATFITRFDAIQEAAFKDRDSEFFGRKYLTEKDTFKLINENEELTRLYPKYRSPLAKKGEEAHIDLIGREMVQAVDTVGTVEITYNNLNDELSRQISQTRRFQFTPPGVRALTRTIQNIDSSILQRVLTTEGMNFVLALHDAVQGNPIDLMNISKRYGNIMKSLTEKEHRSILTNMLNTVDENLLSLGRPEREKVSMWLVDNSWQNKDKESKQNLNTLLKEVRKADTNNVAARKAHIDKSKEIGGISFGNHLLISTQTDEEITKIDPEISLNSIDQNKKDNNVSEEDSSITLTKQDKKDLTTLPELERSNPETQDIKELNSENVLLLFNTMTKLRTDEFYATKEEMDSHTKTLETVLEILAAKLDDTFKLNLEVENIDGVSQGRFFTKSKQVRISLSRQQPLSNVHQSPQESYVHELLHAMTHYALKDSPLIKKELETLFKRVKLSLTRKYGKGKEFHIFLPEGRDPKEASGAELRYAFKEYTFVFDSPQNEENKLDEFLAYALTNKPLLSFLKRFPLAEKQGLFDKLIDIIKKVATAFANAMGLSSKKPVASTAFHEMLAIAERLVAIQHKHESLYNKAEARTFRGLDQTDQKIRFYALNGAKAILTATAKNEFTKGIQELVRSTYRGFSENDLMISAKYQMLEKMNLFLRTNLQEVGRGVLNDDFVQQLLITRVLIGKARQSVELWTADWFNKVWKSVEPGKKHAMPVSTRRYLTDVILRTDLSSLLDQDGLDMSPTDIANLINNPTAVSAEMNKMISRLGKKPSDEVIQYTEELGYWMATGLRGLPQGRVGIYAIAKDYNIVSESEIQLLSALATLSALKHTDTHKQERIKTLINSELAADTKENGFISMLQMHKLYVAESKKILFKANPTHQIKGYIVERVDNLTELRTGTKANEAKFRREGFKKNWPLTRIPGIQSIHDTLYATYTLPELRDQSGMMPTTNQRNMGTTLTEILGQNPKYQIDGKPNFTAINLEIEKIRLQEEAKKKAILKSGKSFSPGDHKLSPLLDTDNKVIDYRVMLSHEDTEEILNPDLEFQNVFGHMRSSFIDRQFTIREGKKTVDLLVDEYQQMYHAHQKLFVNLLDPKSVYINRYRKLPKEVRDYIQEYAVKGRFMVREDVIPKVFGYTPYDLSQLPFVQGEHMGNYKNNLRKFNEIVKDTMSWGKDRVVIALPNVSFGNLVSNLAQLSMRKIPPSYINGKLKEGMSEYLQYRKDVKQRYDLDREIKSKNLGEQSPEQKELTALTVRIQKNKVHRLNRAGLDSIIVEDLNEAALDGYVNKVRRLLKEDKYENLVKLPKTVSTLASWLFMTKGSVPYKYSRQMVQMTDFLARYVMIEHATNVKGVPFKTALHEAINAFVLFDEALYPSLEFIDSLGATSFISYFLRNQRSSTDIIKTSPTSVGISAVVQEATGIPTLGNINAAWPTGDFEPNLFQADDLFESATSVAGFEFIAYFGKQLDELFED